MDHYTTLGVGKNATADDIKLAYRKLASVHHPDKGGDTAQFQKIQAAYETLGDPNKRQEYDNPHRGFHGGHGGMPGGFGMHGFPGGFSFSTGGMDINDLFGQMFGNQARANPTYKTTVNVTLEQVLNGHEQVLNFNTHSGNHTISIKIPVGVDNGDQMRYDNLIPDASLIVEFRIYHDPKFERRGLDLYTEVEVSVLDLITGTVIDFESLSGKRFKVTIPPKSQPNGTLRVAKEGLMRNNTKGDQYILLKPTMPDIIDDEIVQMILRTRQH